MEWYDSLDSMGKFEFWCGVASILGAVISIYQMIMAKSAAQEAENAKNEVLERKRAVDFSAFCVKANEIERVLIGWTNSSQGRDFDDDYKNIQTFISELNMVIPQIKNEVRTNIEDQYTKINKKLVLFKDNDDNNIKEIANDMLFSVRLIVRDLKKIINV